MSAFDTSHLRFIRSGKIYRLRNGNGLTVSTVRSIFKLVVEKAGKQVGSRILRHPVNEGKTELGLLSLVLFRSEFTPVFLSETSSIVDIRHGYVALFERLQYALVATANFSWSEALAEKVLSRLSRGEMQYYAAHDSLANEIVDIRSLDIVDASFRSQKTTGVDLSGSFPTTGANRSLLTSLGVKKAEAGSIRLGLSSAAVRSGGGRISHSDFAAWATAVIDGVDRAIIQRSTNSFIGMFATPLDLNDLPSEVYPIAMLLWLDELTADLQAGRVKLRWRSRRKNVPGKSICSARVERFLEAARASMRLTRNGSGNLYHVDAPAFFGPTWVKSNLRSYSVQTRWTSRIEVVDTSNQDATPLSSWLQRERCLHLVFSDIRYAFSDNTLFRDARIEGQIGKLQGMVYSRSQYLDTTTEKGIFNSSTTAWDAGCLFDLVEKEFSDATTLICDDMKGEWADYIAVRDGQAGSILYFVHCKAGPGHLAPSEFEVVVSQAIKNLGRRHMTDEDISGRKQRWSETVFGTAVPRIRIGGTGDDVETHMRRAMSRPDVQARVVLAVNFLSKSAVTRLHDKVSRGEPINELETQLAWLLTSFMSVCVRFGLIPEVWCRA